MTALQLFQLDPVVKGRQHAALEAIRLAGWDGLASDELGAHVHGWQGKHPADETCEWCPVVARELGTKLRDLKLVRQRRVTAPGRDTYMVWVTVDAKPVRVVQPFEWPDGF